MSTQSIICLIIFALAVISYILNKIPMGLTSLTAMFLLIVTGCVDPAAALGNFANSSAIIMASMFVIAAGLNRTQMVHKISNLVYKVSGGSFTKGMIGYVLVTALIAQVVPSAILIFSICYPLVADYCRKLGVSPSKAMFLHRPHLYYLRGPAAYWRGRRGLHHQQYPAGNLRRGGGVPLRHIFPDVCQAAYDDCSDCLRYLGRA